MPLEGLGCEGCHGTLVILDSEGFEPCLLAADHDLMRGVAR